MKYIVIPIWIFIVIYLLYQMFKYIKHIKYDTTTNPVVNKIKLIALTTQIPLAIIIASWICINILLS